MVMNKLLRIATLTAVGALFFTGCSMKDPFGVGYDSSVCNNSKSFGVCGAPKDVYKYRDKIREVQNKYLKARLDTTLYFAVNPQGVIQVKSDRDAPWERYDISDWYTLIEEKIKEEDMRIKENEEKAKAIKKKISANCYGEECKARKAVDWTQIVESDLPVTKGGDLSVKYQKQGPLLVTRTKIGNIIRDQGLIQEVFVANYSDTDGDLVSSHEVFVVVREPDWVVGERTPKNVKLESFPTPISQELIKKQQVVNSYQEKTISSYNVDTASGYAESKKEPVKENTIQDSAIINNFLNQK